MKTRTLLGLALVIACIITASCGSNNDEGYQIGGKSIAIPSPDAALVEISDTLRPMFDVFVPSVNRMITVFLLEDELPAFLDQSVESGLSRYAMVEVTTQIEPMNVSEDDFREYADAVKLSLAGGMDSLADQTFDEITERLNNIDPGALGPENGGVIQLGTFFEKKDIYGAGLVMTVKFGESTVVMGVCMAEVRVKGKLIHNYLYRVYEDESTIDWLKTTSERWADSILVLNQ